MGLKTCEKEATQKKHVKAKTKQTKIQSFWVMASRTLEQVYVHMNSAYMRKLDHAYANPYLENLKTQKQSRTLKVQTNNLRIENREITKGLNQANMYENKPNQK